MKKIALTTKEELNIYMSPVRQQLLRQLGISNAPMTPKMLADKLQISASSVQYHIKKLIPLGVIELDHTEIINGITARYYKPAQVTVQIGLCSTDIEAKQKEVLVQNLVAQVYEGYRNQLKKRVKIRRDLEPEKLQKWGDILTGVAYLGKQEAEGLMKLIKTYIDQHAKPAPERSPWEYAIIAYNAGEISDD